MNIYKWGLLICVISFHIPSFGQKLKKADRAIVSNFQTHVKNLNSKDKADSTEEDRHAEYVGKQFARFGLKPAGDSSTWFQTFTIDDGEQILPGTALKLNEASLTLHKDYFPFAFSADKSTEAAVAIALAENGVPWFKELGELLDRGDDSSSIDTLELIRTKAAAAADKGATALIIYNAGSVSDLSYDAMARQQDVSIPVLYLTTEASKKYLADESAIFDLNISVRKKHISRTGRNVLGYADNKGDSTVFATANLSNPAGVAALLETVRLIKQSKSRRKNYLFAVYCGEDEGKHGELHMEKHPVAESVKVSRKVKLDDVAVQNANPKSLHLVRQSVDLIK